jgi:hypothetical protein
VTSARDIAESLACPDLLGNFEVPIRSTSRGRVDRGHTRAGPEQLLAAPAPTPPRQLRVGRSRQTIGLASWEDCHSVGGCLLVAYTHPRHLVTMRPNPIPSIQWPLRDYLSSWGSSPTFLRSLTTWRPTLVGGMTGVVGERRFRSCFGAERGLAELSLLIAHCSLLMLGLGVSVPWRRTRPGWGPVPPAAHCGRTRSASSAALLAGRQSAQRPSAGTRPGCFRRP